MAPGVKHLGPLRVGMVTYWLLFLLPALAAVTPTSFSAEVRRVLWLALFGIFTAAIGLRYEVGCDWAQYLRHYEAAVAEPLADALVTYSDPGYAALNWLSAELHGGILLVNTISAAIFMVGLTHFVRQQPLSLLALALAVPYLVVVVSMGYTRQAVALGFAMWALSSHQRTPTLKYFMLVLMGALFHKSALTLLPLGFIGMTERRRILRTLLIFTSVLFGALALLIEHYQALWDTYIEGEKESSGAAIRIAMNAVAGLVFFTCAKQWDARWHDGYLWRWFAWAALLCTLLVAFASTAVDRLGLYLIPFQVVVFSRAPLLFQDHAVRGLVVFSVLTAYGATLFVWVNFAAHAFCWVPYRNALVGS